MNILTAKTKTAGAVALALAILLGGQAPYALASANLITNPSLEETAGTDPASWRRGGWGSNVRVLEYPVAGHQSDKAAQVTITSYSSGDAKWYFDQVPVTAGKTYRWSGYYKSTVPSFVTVEFKMAGGGFRYLDIASPGPAADWQRAEASFTAPDGAVAATVFHLIKQTGSLAVDTQGLMETDVQAPPPDPSNLIFNPSAEAVDSNGDPIGWGKGRWGTNQAVFEYPTSGYQSTAAMKVTLKSRTSGDAKWYPREVEVAPGSTYVFSDVYKSDIPSYVTVEFRKSDGARSYVDLAELPPSAGWTAFQKEFTVPAGAVAATVFHLIKQTGSLETDAFSLKAKSSVPPPSGNVFPYGIVSLNFDDGWRSIYDNALPIMDRAGLKSTQFIVSGRLGDDFPGYVSAAEVLDMQARGHEIGAHTRTHADLTALSPDEAWAEINGSRQDLLAIGADPVNYFAYPFGAYNESTKQMVRDAGFAAGRSSDGGFNYTDSDRWAIKRQSVEVNTSVETVKEWIATAVKDKTWLVLLFHRVDHSGTRYSVTPENFQAIVDYLAGNDVPVVTLKEAFELRD